MRFASQCLLLALCAALALLPFSALGEGNPVPETEDAGEEIIAPRYPVPDYVTWLIDTARGEIGYKEESGGVTKYGTWAGYPTAEWCAEFLCWCVHRVDTEHKTRLLNNTYPNYSGTNVGRNWFLSQGRYVARTGVVPGYGSQWWKDSGEPMERNAYIPQPGDWMFLSDNANGDTSHVALVEYCAYGEDGKVRVHVIEGNNLKKPAPQSVEQEVYSLDYWQILGYGTVYDVADITLKFGHDGPKVKALQEELVQAGLLEPQYTTGRYGAITTAAIKTVQRISGILETGVANRETCLALHALAREKTGFTVDEQ